MRRISCYCPAWTTEISQIRKSPSTQSGLSMKDGTVMFHTSVCGDYQTGRADPSWCGARAEIIAENRGSLISWA